MAAKKPIKSTPQKQAKAKQPVLPTFEPNIWFAVICAVAGFCLYLNTVKHEYVLDDVGAITGNEYVTEGISGIPKILSVGMWHFDNVNLGYYRPLSMITFAIENEFFPGNPHVSHLGNVILYGLTGFFLCMLLMNLFRNYHPAFSFLITLLFITHPIHTEVVANIKSRDEILAFLNLIIALFLYLKYFKLPNTPNSETSNNQAKHGAPAVFSFFIPGLGQIIKGHLVKAIAIWCAGILIGFSFWIFLIRGELVLSAIFYILPTIIWLWNIYDAYNSNINRIPSTIKFLIPSLAFFYLALLSKESAMTGLLIAPLAIFFKSNLTIKQSLMRAIPFALMILIFQAHKAAVLGSLEAQIPKDIVNYPYAEAGTKLPTTFYIFLHSMRMIIFPHPLSYDYSYNEIPAVTFASGGVLLGFLLAVALAYFSFKGLLKKNPVSLGVLLFCATLAPAMAFVFLRGGIFAERFLYAPSLGFSIAIIFLLVKFSKINLFSSELQLPALAKEMKLILPVGVLIILYSFKTVTRNPVWHDNMTLFSTDVNASPNSCQVRRHYGSELINKGIAAKDPNEKSEWFNKGTAQIKEALRINPRFGDAYFKLGVAYQTVRINNDSAIYYYTRAIQEAPGYAISYNNMGILYEGQGKQELASYYYNKAVDVNPYFPDGLRNRDNHRKKTGLDVRMFPTSTNLDSLERATPPERRDYNFYYKLGTDYASKGDYQNASLSLEKAVALNPTFVDALVNLANCYGMLKNYSKNIEVLNKVVALYPNNVQALGNLAVTYELIGNKDKSEEYRDKVRELTGQ